MEIKKSPPYLQLALLGFLLVVFPLGSYLYLKAGYDYRKAALIELEKYGSVNEFINLNSANRQKVNVVYTTPEATTDSVATSILNLHAAFDNQPWVSFIGLGTGSSKLIDDAVQAHEVNTSSVRMSDFENLTVKDSHCVDVPLFRRAVLVDTSGTIRRCYDLHIGKEVNRMVEHINIIVPKEEQEDIYYEREQEY